RSRTYDQGIQSLRRFRREWTISSPAAATLVYAREGAGCSSLSLRALSSFAAALLELSGSLCTFRRCTAGSAQGCRRKRATGSLNSSRPLHGFHREGTISMSPLL